MSIRQTNPTTSPKTSAPNFPYWLTISTIATLLPLKFYFFMTTQSQMGLLYFVSFIQDAFLFIANYFLFIFCLKRFSKASYLTHILFYIFHLIMGIVSFVYTFFLLDMLSFPVNIFGITAANVAFFMEYFMNVKLLLALLVLIGLIIAMAYFLPRRMKLGKFPAVAGALLTVLFIPTILRGSINPLLYSVQEQIALTLTADRGMIKLTNPVADDREAKQFQFLDKALRTAPVVNIRYNRVLVLVMEGVNFDDFITKSRADVNSFLNRQKQNLVAYENYYTLNLDSYTSLIAILNSIFIPYQAYVHEQKYAFVNNRNNLIRFFTANGFSAHFLTSYGKQQERFVPNLKDWTQAQFMDDIENNTRYACIATNKIEYACEDLSVFDDLRLIFKNQRRAFVFQEMVYGHTAGWKEKTGLETIDYYNRYFNKVVDELKNNRMLDSTIVVITSDHGPRENACEVGNYHIPLLVFAADLKSSANRDFLSHLDFKDILLEFVANLKLEPAQQPIYTMGNSGELIYGMITAGGKHAFINNRMRHARGNATKAEIQSLNQNFQKYLNYFESLNLNSK